MEKLAIELTHYKERDTWYAQTGPAGEFKGFGPTKWEALHDLVDTMDQYENESATLFDQLRASIERGVK